MDNENQNRTKSKARWISAPRVALIVAVILIVCFVRMKLVRRPIPFDSAQWRNAAPSDRGRMAHHPSFKEAILGVSEDEVVKLLGPPLDVSPYPKEDEGRRMLYEIRLPFDFFSTLLLVDLDQDSVSSIKLMGSLDSEDSDL